MVLSLRHYTLFRHGFESLNWSRALAHPLKGRAALEAAGHREVHAVHRAARKDAGRRRMVLVLLPNPLPGSPKKENSGFRLVEVAALGRVAMDCRPRHTMPRPPRVPHAFFFFGSRLGKPRSHPHVEVRH